MFNVVGSCSFHIRALRHIRPCLTFDAAKSVAVSIVGARLDYCNGLLYGISQRNFDCLQRVLAADPSAFQLQAVGTITFTAICIGTSRVSCINTNFWCHCALAPLLHCTGLMPNFTALKQSEAILNTIRSWQVTSGGNVVYRSKLGAMALQTKRAALCWTRWSELQQSILQSWNQ